MNKRAALEVGAEVVKFAAEFVIGMCFGQWWLP